MLELIDIWKYYEGQPLLRGISFSVGMGETVCLLGPSGSGKSTLLRIISGLEQADSGRLLWDGVDLAGTPPYKRNFGLMFQDYALFPHRNVAENVAFGLRMQNRPSAEIDRRVEAALELVNLSAFARRRVTELSGGEQQRVALARALAPEPRLIMLDEPVAALDRSLREQLTDDLRHILHATGIPAIYVTHDQAEAFAIADRLILLYAGQIAQAGTPAEVYTQPASVKVARFFGLGNLLAGKVVNLLPFRVETAVGVFEPGCGDKADRLGQPVTLLLRPNGAHLLPAAPPTGPSPLEPCVNCIRGRVEEVAFRGGDFHVEVACQAGVSLSFDLERPPERGQLIAFGLAPGSILCLVDSADPAEHLGNPVLPSKPHAS